MSAPGEDVPGEEVPGEETEEAPAQGVKRTADDVAEEDESAAKKQRTEEAESASEAAPGDETETPAANGAAPAAATEAEEAAPEEPEPECPAGTDRGVVKWFDLKKGYGFITRDQGEEDVFVHQSCLVNQPGYKGLVEKQVVWFKTTTEASGRLRAHDLTAPGGGPVKSMIDPDAAPQTPATVLPEHTKEPLAAGRLRGQCKWYNSSKGFGFITPEIEPDSGDVFVHQSVLLSKGQGPGMRTLAEGENVEYEISPEPGEGKAKLKACNVTGPGGAYVVGAVQPQQQMGGNMMGNMMGGMGMMGLPGMMRNQIGGGNNNMMQAAQQYAQYYQQQQQQMQQQMMQQQQQQQQQQQPGANSNDQSQTDAMKAYQNYYAQYYQQQQQQQPQQQQQQPQQGGGGGGADPYAAYYQQMQQYYNQGGQQNQS